MSPTAREPAQWSMRSICPSLEPFDTNCAAASYAGRYIVQERAHMGDSMALVPLPSVSSTLGSMRPCLSDSPFAYLGSRPHVCAYRIHLLAIMPRNGKCSFRSCWHPCLFLHQPGELPYPAPNGIH